VGAGKTQFKESKKSRDVKFAKPGGLLRFFSGEHSKKFSRGGSMGKTLLAWIERAGDADFGRKMKRP